MINHKKVIAIIPARAGSKGLVKKNLALLAGKPLIAWTIEEAKKSTYIDQLIVSTDGEDISQVARDYGAHVPFMRSETLAKDDTAMMEVILDVLDKMPEYDYVILLQPTSPLRVVQDIDACLELCDENNAPACVSVSPAKGHPYWMYYFHQKSLIPLVENANNVTRRQDLPPVYQLNGAVYVAKTQWLRDKKTFMTKETLGYNMPKNRSVDIDDEFDFQLAACLLQ